MDNGKSVYKGYTSLVVLFISILLISHIVSLTQIINSHFTIFGIKIILDGGVILYSLSSIFVDILTEIYGYKYSKRVIWLGLISILLTSICFKIIGVTQGDLIWGQYINQPTHGLISGGISSIAILIISLITYLLREFTNSYTLVRIKQITGSEFLWVRTIGSTMVAQIIDTVIFIFIIYIYGLFPLELVYLLAISNYMYKIVIEILFMPVTYLITDTIKQIDGQIIEGQDINFNPFTL